MNRRFRSTTVMLGAGCALVAAVIALAAAIEANRQDRSALQTQFAVAEFETADGYLDMLGQLKHTAFNQGAFDNIVLRWNPDWIDNQFLSHLKYTGIPNVAVYGPGGALRRLDAEQGEQRLTEKSLAVASGVDTLLAAVDRARGKGESAPQKGIVVADGRVFFAAAAAVTPQEISDAPVDDDLKYTVVFLKPAEDDHFALLSVGFKAKDVHIVTTPSASEAFAVFPLTDANGTPHAFLQWRPQKPGISFLTVLLPVLFVMFVGLAATLAVAAARWQKAQKKLLDSEAKAAAAQEESRIKSVFLGNVSHELRTPLNAIIGFAEMLDMKLFGPLGAKQYEEYAADILTSGRELLRTVNDLIEISHIQAHDAAIPSETVDVAQCLAEAVGGARALAALKNVTLCIEDDKGGVWCRGSRLRLRQALSRLIENAVQNAEDGQRIALSWLRADGDVVIVLRDPATRLTKEEQQHFGKLFVYSDTHYVTRQGGIGLNLAIAHGLTKAMGGRINVTCAGDKGCVILLHLPQAEAPAAANQAA